jgi:hypothetical protein
LQNIFGNGKNNAKLKKVPPKLSSYLGKNDGKIILKGNLGISFAYFSIDFQKKIMIRSKHVKQNNR